MEIEEKKWHEIIIFLKEILMIELVIEIVS